MGFAAGAPARQPAALEFVWSGATGHTRNGAPLWGEAQPGLFVSAGCNGGGVFGDHCSPLSDTSILASTGAASDHIDHIKTQMPYALVVGAVSVAAYLLIGAAI